MVHPKTLSLFVLFVLFLLYHSIFRLEILMNYEKKCFSDEEACLEDLNVVLTVEINMKTPVKKYFEEINKLLLL